MGMTTLAQYIYNDPGMKNHFDEQVSCPTLIDVDYRFFDPDRDIDLVKWYADRIDCAKAVACLKSRSAEDDSDNEYEQDYEDETEKDFSICCRISV
ncbi:hypothetical protein BDA96_06G238600 [Sorghum bicolor]|uniref:Uncharacterized protein n=2 Tax=Sorghum bicolor TaxID=4558 RepID=A0A921UDH4_SORBI|nr:hypothetical protein BDA96_06G238600 [Sorghum bicolor]OQU82344.1 hypothetical protein SORBI_3006G218050 [Sorghum bicolor]